jgi:hypothetical protein
VNNPYNKYPYGTKEYWLKELYNARADYVEASCMSDTFLMNEASWAKQNARKELKNFDVSDEELYPS